jgi:hypothetical protein
VTSFVEAGLRWMTPPAFKYSKKERMIASFVAPVRPKVVSVGDDVRRCYVFRMYMTDKGEKLGDRSVVGGPCFFRERFIDEGQASFRLKR